MDNANSARNIGKRLTHLIYRPNWRMLSPPSAQHFVLDERSFHFIAKDEEGCEPAEMPIADFVYRIAQQAGPSHEALLYSWIWIQQLRSTHPHFDISSWTIHRLFLAAIIVAVKYCDDDYVSNADFSVICGLPLDRVNALERYFLLLKKWQLYVNPATPEFYNLYISCIMS